MRPRTGSQPTLSQAAGWLLGGALLLLPVPGRAWSALSTGTWPNATATRTAPGGVVSGRIADAATGEPVTFAYLHVEELSRSATSDLDGRFDLGRLPDGQFTLSVHRIGYRHASISFRVEGDAPVRLDIRLIPDAITGETVVVSGQEDLQGGTLGGDSRKLAGDELRVNLSQTLGQTLSRLPGFSQRSMGGAPSRPVIRGLGGERVVILQDGQRSGDVSAQSADHAVSVDPLGADEVQILRGPAALAYSPNAVGGIVNQVDNRIPTSRVESLTGELSLQGDGSTLGLAGDAQFKAPLGPFTLHAGWIVRTGGDTRTPEGSLTNTAHDTRTGLLGMGGQPWGASLLAPSVALAAHRPWGYAGLASHTYASRYGIPPDPEGGHPLGVDVEMQKWQLQGRTEIQPADSKWIELAYASFLINQYNHKELEAGGSVGTEFGQVTGDFTGKIRHRPFAPSMESGWLGVWAESLDYAVRGAGTPDSKGMSAGLFLIESATFKNIRLEGGLRIDAGSRRPLQEDPDSRIGDIRRRDFLTWAGALTLSWSSESAGSARSSGVAASAARSGTRGVWTSELTLIRTARIPSMEELFSEGPHLASYSYEIGNPDLEAETALTGEFTAGWALDRLAVDVTVFHSEFGQYLYPRNTGRRNFRYPSLFDYQYTADQARLHGVEGRLALRPLPDWRFSADASLVMADRRTESGSEPLPMIPPASGNLSLEWLPGATTVAARVAWAARQDRLGEFETPTDGYVRFDLTLGTRFMRAGRLHTLGLSALNLTDTVYRHHLSRVKDLYPEAGRHVQVLYRLYF